MNLISLLSFSRYPLRSRRALVVGMVMGFLWLYPAWGPPQMVLFDKTGAQPIRIARILSSLLVWLLVPRPAVMEVVRSLAGRSSNGRTRWIRTLLVVSILFSLLPLLTGFMNNSQPFFISAVMPILISILALVGICLLDDETIRAWLIGISVVALGFVCAGIATTGLETNAYFGRPRVSFGFFHPQFSGTALFGAAMFLPLLLYRWFNRQPLAIRMFLALSYLAPCMTLLQMAQSRNLFVAVLLCIACAAWALLANGPGRVIVFLSILAAPLLVYGFALFGSASNPLWAEIDLLSSLRLTIYQRFLTNLVRQSEGSLLLAPNNKLFDYLSTYAGFGAVDSVYLSLFFNFGLLSLLFLVMIVMMCGIRLSRSRQTAFAYGVLCGIVMNFALAEQGLTVSNLAVFIAFSYTVRAALRMNVAVK